MITSTYLVIVKLQKNLNLRKDPIFDIEVDFDVKGFDIEENFNIGGGKVPDVLLMLHHQWSTANSGQRSESGRRGRTGPSPSDRGDSERAWHRPTATIP